MSMPYILAAASRGLGGIRDAMKQGSQLGGDGFAIVLLCCGIALALVVILLMFTDFYRLRRFFRWLRGHRE
jgi:hypothetical protein